MAIKNRRYGREARNGTASIATHQIKIGWNAAQDNARHSKPAKLPGFLLCRDTVGEDGRPEISYDLMRLYDVEPEAIQAALKAGQNGSADLLPRELNFVISANAVRVGDSWDFPNTLSENYACWDDTGLFCTGDGETAMRRRDDGTKMPLECVPVGQTGAKPVDFCTYSVDGACKPNVRLVVMLIEPGPDGLPQPLGRKFQNRFRLDTTSEAAGMDFAYVLGDAAERLNGRIQGITGTLRWSLRKRISKAGRFPEIGRAHV